ncbi:TetR family transcriptional regulator [Leucobacter albus]|uniref:TetR family transcriptional regulator n=1 Tax=Leucobacter albus TaxID=272210 RepID=A0ABW3TIZ6_9MICO
MDAAADLFTAKGYTGTALVDIAHAADVSVETVKLVGPKRRLLLNAFTHSFAGSDDIASLADHGPVAEITAEIDNTRYLAGIVHFVAESNRRSSLLWTTLLSAAASDALLREDLDGLQQRRRADILVLVDELRRRGLTQTNRSRETTADAISFMLSPEGYNQLVLGAGWTQPDYEAWLASSIPLTCT